MYKAARARIGVIAFLSISALAIAGCSAGGGGGGNGDATYKFGQVTTISGGFPFGGTVQGTQSYINMLNDNGGLNGHKVELVSGDDKGDAAESAQVARKLIQQDGVLGFVGNTSLIDCSANRGIYEANDIAVVGSGVQTDCYQQPNWMPTTGGPFVGAWVMWTYAYETLKAESICLIGQNDPSGVPYYEQLRKAFEKENDMTFTLVTYSNDTTQDPTPAITNAKNSGCDAIVTSTVAPNLAAMVKAAKTVGLDATFVDAGSAYDTTLAATLGADGEPGALGPKSQGIIVGAQMTPLDDPDPEVQEMVAQLEQDGVQPDFWSQLGWAAAKVFFDGLSQQTTEYSTPADVRDALRSMKPVESALFGTSIAFGDGETHSPNTSFKILQISDGAFIEAPDVSGGWIVIDPLPAPEASK